MRQELKAQLDRIFYPRAVAVVGPSSRPGNFGRMFVEGLVNFGCPRIYPVHPEEKELLGLKVYPSLAHIPDQVDLAIVATPAQAVAGVVEECARKGVQGVVIYTSGFGEMGEAGRRLQDEVVALARARGTRLIGPNCMGVHCPEGKVAAGAGTSRIGGPAAMLSQSGFLGHSIIALAASRGVGFGKAVSYGNACDLGAADFLEYFGQDPETKVIVAYMEGVSDGRRLLEVARQVSPRKPILALKGGVTGPGGRAAASHTGSLAGSSQAWEAFFRQAGIVQARSTDELIDYLVAFHYLPRPQGRRVAIISAPGGGAVVATDACTQAGLEVIPLSARTQQRLAQVVGAVGTSIANPVDLGFWAMHSPHMYAECLRILVEEERVDIFLVIGAAEQGLEQHLGPAVAQVARPVAVVFLGQPSSTLKAFWDRGIPVYRDARRAINALARLAEYAEFATAWEGARPEGR